MKAHLFRRTRANQRPELADPIQFSEPDHVDVYEWNRAARRSSNRSLVLTGSVTFAALAARVEKSGAA